MSSIVVDAVPGLDHDFHHFRAQSVAGVRPVQRDDEGVTALLDQALSGTRLFVCWSLGHGYRLSLDIEHQLVKKCNTF